MSKSFIYNLFSINKLLFKSNHAFDDDTEKTLKLFTRVLLVSCVGLSHGIYAYSTCKHENFIIVKKYKMSKNGYTDFMVIDNKGRHFNVNNSFWYNKWNSIEDWHNLEENNHFNFKYYGWRIPIFGIFPNVVKYDKNTDT
jgi:hypothetical protein